MPYIHWESEDKRGEMSQMIKEIQSSEEYDLKRIKRMIKKLVGKEEHYSNANHALLANYLFTDPPRSPLHIRRTLNQFQYYMTEDTDARDADQVIARYFQRRHKDKPVPIMMIDQLWLWIVNNGKHRR